MKNLLSWGAVLLVLFGVIFGVYKFSANEETKVVAAAGRDSITVEENILGAKDSRIAVVEYADFQCPACKAYYEPINRLQAELGDEMVLVYRNFPLRQIHKHAQLSSQAAEAAANQGMFWPYHDLLFKNQESWSTESDPTATFEQYAADLELDVEQFKTDMNSDEVKARIQSDVDSGYEAAVTGTPTLFVNGIKLNNPRSYEELKRLVLNAAEKSN